MIINNNIPALNTHRQLGINQNAMQNSMEKLSSGLRINRAGDDAAGLAISEKMRAQINGLDQASRNSQDGISLIQTAEGALQESHDILQRMRELAVQSANDTNVDVDREELQKEVDQLSAELTRISDTTEFNTQSLLDGTLENKFHIGANQGQNIDLNIANMSAQALEVVSDVTNIGQSGAGVKGIEADLGFNLDGFSLTATGGGAIAARLTGDNSNVVDEFAPDIEANFANGITTNTAGGNFEFAGGNVTIAADAGAGFDWNQNLDEAGTNTISVAVSTSGAMLVSISAQATGGQTFTSVNDRVTANTAGDFVYDEHGVSFTINDGTLATGGEFTLNLDDIIDSSGAGAIASHAVDSNITVNTDAQQGAGVTSNIISTVGITADDLLDGSGQIDIQVTGIATGGAATITVTINTSGGNTALSTDTYTYDGSTGASLGDTFTYTNHGIDFTIDLTGVDRDDLDTIGFTQSIDVQTNVLDLSTANTAARTMEFSIADEDGNAQTITVVLSDGVHELSDLVSAINAQATTGFGGAIAAVNTAGDNIILTSNFEGESTITVATDGDIAGLLTGGDANVRAGAEDSVDLTFSNGTDTYTDTIAPSDNSVRFIDGDGNRVQFDLRGFDNLQGVNVGEVFAASDFSRDTAGIDISSQAAADSAISVINDAIETVSAERSKLGATQNRLEHTISNLDNISENLSAAESRIRDVDMAREMMEMTRANILSQASQSMLAQANQQPQAVLQLLG